MLQVRNTLNAQSRGISCSCLTNHSSEEQCHCHQDTAPGTVLNRSGKTVILGAGKEERESRRACASGVVVWDPAGTGQELGAWSAAEKGSLDEESMFVALQGQGDGGKLDREHTYGKK